MDNLDLDCFKGHFFASYMFAYFKVNESNRDIYERAQSKPFPHGISYWEVPTDVLEENTKLHEWANISIKNAQEAARKKRK